MKGFTDIHCHLLAGVDDGPLEMREALELLRMEAQQGVTRAIVTPHWRRGMFETSAADRLKSFQRLQWELRMLRIPIELRLGCEYHVEHGMPERLKKEKGYSMADSRYVLTEFSGETDEKEVTGVLRELTGGGYRPIIAHLERYPKVRSPQQAEAFIRAGAYIQVNAGSLLGAEGWGTRRAARRLLDMECVHFIGSDAHSTGRRKPRLAECADWIEKKYGEKTVSRLLIENPKKIVEDIYL